MSIIHSQDSDQAQNSDIVVNINFEDDDLITFKHDTKTINLHYSQLTKYSKHIRDSYLFSDVNDRFPQEIYKIQEEFQLSTDSIDYFFQLLEQNYNINNQSKLTYIHCVDLLKISEYLEVRKLSFKINEYINDQKIYVDFIIQMIQYEHKIQTKTNNDPYSISKEMEQKLSSQINDCLSNEKFKELPIQIIHRVISKSSPNSINSNKLFDIIMTSFNKFCVLFQFLDLQKLSEDRLDDLCEIYSNSDENTLQYFNYLKCNLNLIREINKRKKNLEATNDDQNNKMNEFKLEISSLQKKFNDSEITINKLQNQLNDSNELNNKQQNKVMELESKLSLLQKQLNKFTLIKGSISAKVENGLFISAEINLEVQNSQLDTSKAGSSLAQEVKDQLDVKNMKKENRSHHFI